MSWIPVEERIHADTCQVVMLPEMDLPCHCLVAHAAEADRRIAERDKLIWELVEQLENFFDDEGNLADWANESIATLNRVAAYQKEQA